MLSISDAYKKDCYLIIFLLLIFQKVPGALECCISSDDIFSLFKSPGKTLVCFCLFLPSIYWCFLHPFVTLRCMNELRWMINKEMN